MPWLSTSEANGLVSTPGRAAPDDASEAGMPEPPTDTPGANDDRIDVTRSGLDSRSCG